MLDGAPLAGGTIHCWPTGRPDRDCIVEISPLSAVPGDAEEVTEALRASCCGQRAPRVANLSTYVSGSVGDLDGLPSCVRSVLGARPRALNGRHRLRIVYPERVQPYRDDVEGVVSLRAAGRAVCALWDTGVVSCVEQEETVLRRRNRNRLPAGTREWVAGDREACWVTGGKLYCAEHDTPQLQSSEWGSVAAIGGTPEHLCSVDQNGSVRLGTNPLPEIPLVREMPRSGLGLDCSSLHVCLRVEGITRCWHKDGGLVAVTDALVTCREKTCCWYDSTRLVSCLNP